MLTKEIKAHSKAATQGGHSFSTFKHLGIEVLNFLRMTELYQSKPGDIKIDSKENTTNNNQVVLGDLTKSVLGSNLITYIHYYPCLNSLHTLLPQQYIFIVNHLNREHGIIVCFALLCLFFVCHCLFCFIPLWDRNKRLVSAYGLDEPQTLAEKRRGRCFSKLDRTNSLHPAMC